MDNDFKSLFHETPPAAGGGFALIEQGTYEAEITEAKLDLTRNPEQISLQFQITQEPYVGRVLFGNYNLTGVGIGYLKKDLDILGLNYSEVGGPEDIAQLLWDNLPMRVICFVNQKEASNSKTYNNVYINELIDPRADEIAAAPAPAPRAAAPAPKAAPQAAKPATTATRPPVKNHAPQKTAAKPKPKNGAGPEPDFGDDTPF